MKKLEMTELMHSLDPWYQRFQIEGDVFTPGYLDVANVWATIAPLISQCEIKNSSVLDVGCNAGYYSFKMVELGASYVLGIDCAEYIRQAQLVKEFLRREGPDFREADLYEYRIDRRYDIILCLGVLYHLRHPFLAIEKLASSTKNLLVVETEVLADPQDSDKMLFINGAYRNDDTNWWSIGPNCLAKMLRCAGFSRVSLHQYSDNHPIYGSGYSLGLSEEGIAKGRRLIAVAFKN